MTEEVVNMPTEVVDLAKKYAELSTEMDALALKKNLLQGEIDQMEEALLAKLDEIGMSSIRLTGIGLLFTRTRVFPKIVGDPEAFIKWCDENCAGEIAPRTVNKKRLGELIKNCMEQDKPLPPPDLVEPSATETSITFKPSKK